MESKTTIELPLMESFYTIQGEGFHQGSAAWFIRLGGCDVGCVWCDVKESWDASLHTKMSIDSIVKPLDDVNAELVVVTGGEPLMYDLAPLTEKIRAKGFQTNVETSGAYPLTGKWDWICLSPKKFKEAREEYFEVADELKIIVFNKSDFAWAEKYASLVSDKCKLFLQPEWEKEKEMLPHVIDYVKENPKWCISLQLHKYLNVP